MEPAFLTQGAGPWARLLSLLFAGSCASCGAAVEHAELGGLCRACWSSELRWMDAGLPLEKGWAMSSASACFAYEGAARKALLSWKFGGRHSFQRPFRSLLLQRCRGLSFDGLAWVPASREGLRLRKRDALGELAEDLAAELGTPLCRLERPKAARKQAELGQKERWENARGMFQARGAAPRRVLLIDDILTTGATLSDASRALREAGAESVQALVIARDELRGN